MIAGKFMVRDQTTDHRDPVRRALVAWSAGGRRVVVVEAEK